MQGGQLENEKNKCVDNLCLFMTKKEGKQLMDVLEGAVDKKVRGAKNMKSKIEKVLFCY